MKSKFNRNQIAIQLEDEHRYGPPSPRQAPFNHNSTPPPLRLNDPSSSDELFLSESYPPTTQIVHLPFFNLKLDSPIGMGRGHPIVPQRTNVPAYGSLDRIWKRITNMLLERPYQLTELVDTLSYPVQHSSLDSLQLLLSHYHLQLPSVVRDHFLTHDGQDIFTSHSTQSSTSAPSLGIVWGLWLMSCEEVEAEYGFWRKFDGGSVPTDAFSVTDFSSTHSHQPQLQHPDHTSSSPITPSSSSSSSTNQPQFNQSMSSCPAGWVHEVYSHPGWLPLLSDRVGNYIGVDLSPPLLQPKPSSSSSSSSSSSPSSFQSPNHHAHSVQGLSSSSIIDPHPHYLGGGQGNARPEPGQVIAFGREIDQKVVLWRGEGSQGWANWLSSFADDLEDGKFARLIGRKSKKSSKRPSTPKRRRNSDGERGHWSNSEDESDDTEDGLGDLGYFNHHTTFVDQDEDGDFYGWKLAPEYRGMSVIEALCARSQQRWAEVGSYSSRHDFSKSKEFRSRPNETRQSSGRTSIIHAGRASSSHSNQSSPKANGTFALGDNHKNPTTPIAFVTPPSPRLGDQTEGNAITPSSKSRMTVMPAQFVGVESSTGLQPTTHNRTQRHQATKIDSKPRRPHVPPPAPMSLGLPTMDSLMLEVEAHPSPTQTHYSQPRIPTNLFSRTTSITPSSSMNDKSNNRTENRFSTSHHISRLSMVGHASSEEMTRGTSSSSSNAAEVSAHHHPSSSPHSKTNSAVTDANQEEVTGAVMIINDDKNSLNDSNAKFNFISTSHTPPISKTISMENQLKHQNQNKFAIKLDSSRPSDCDDVRKTTDGLGILKAII